MDVISLTVFICKQYPNNQFILLNCSIGAVTLKDLRDGKEKLLGIISHYETLKANGQSLFFKVQSVPLNYRWRINTDVSMLIDSKEGMASIV